MTTACKFDILGFAATLRDKAKLILAIATTVIITACGSSTNDIVGEYSVQGKNGLEPTLRVEKSDGNYAVQEFHNGNWRALQGPVKDLTKEQAQALFGRAVTEPVSGISTKDFALVHVPASWSNKDFPTKTGYLLVSMLGPVELQKVK
ncbi:hypothetical protein Q3O97_06200 [Ralstonia pseudosolanacearum]|uniref:hypothetical protein n=1 Tax=Ralstonia pseudosolanacearum TaxID=1310165 RepID=UPI0027072E8D|nr:hypothetical protein [Ralstonia pseudosolanacearum]MDO3615432.1 hypothetical protein [Ralstonia pseudosolanacearum]